jgi:hypothetical protein
VAGGRELLCNFVELNGFGGILVFILQEFRELVEDIVVVWQGQNQASPSIP